MHKAINKIFKNDPIAAAFIVSAAVEFARDVLENQERTRLELAGGFITPDAWIAAARTVVKELGDAEDRAQFSNQ